MHYVPTQTRCTCIILNRIRLWFLRISLSNILRIICVGTFHEHFVEGNLHL